MSQPARCGSPVALRFRELDGLPERRVGAGSIAARRKNVAKVSGRVGQQVDVVGGPRELQRLFGERDRLLLPSLHREDAGLGQCDRVIDSASSGSAIS